MNEKNTAININRGLVKHSVEQDNELVVFIVSETFNGFFQFKY
jgi:hypothetical protein